MWRFCVNPVAEASHAFSFHKQIAQQKCVSPDLKDLRISYFFEKEGHHHGFRKSVFRNGTHGQADAAVRHSVHHLAAGGRAV